MGLGIKICHAFGIDDQKFGYKNGISDEKNIPCYVPDLKVSCLKRKVTYFFCSFLGCDTNLTSLNGTITSLTLPQTQAGSLFCKWNIRLNETAEPRHVELEFTRFNLTGVMPACLNGDYLELFLGCNNSKSVGKFCGQTSLPVIYSPDHCLQIVFHAPITVVTSLNSKFSAVYNQRLLSRGG